MSNTFATWRLIILATVASVVLLSLSCVGLAGYFLLRTPGPYPESAAIVDHLKRNAHDPWSVEVIEWGNRVYDPAAKQHHIFVKYRAKNALGMPVLESMLFIVGEDGRILNSWPSRFVPKGGLWGQNK